MRSFRGEKFRGFRSNFLMWLGAVGVVFHLGAVGARAADDDFLRGLGGYVLSQGISNGASPTEPLSLPSSTDNVCLNEITSYDPAPVSEVAAVMSAVKRHCVDETLCGTPELKQVLDKVTEQPKHRRHRGWLRKMLLIPRRILVPALYITSVVGPATATYFIAKTFQIEDGLRVVLGSSASALSGFLLGRFGSALENMVGPHLYQTAMIIWDPSEKDGWGRIQKTLNEKDRLTKSQMYNQILLFGRHFEVAGKSLRTIKDIDAELKEDLNHSQRDKLELKRDHELSVAAAHYANAILNSWDLFGGLHYYHPATVRAARTNLPRTGRFQNEINLSADEKIELIIRVCRTIQEKPSDELTDDTERDELVRFAFSVMLRWLIVHDKGYVNDYLVQNDQDFRKWKTTVVPINNR